MYVVTIIQTAKYWRVFVAGGEHCSFEFCGSKAEAVEFAMVFLATLIDDVGTVTKDGPR